MDSTAEETKTIWNSDGTDGPCLICAPKETEEDTEPTRPHTATYSPEDDKIRIYPAYRLPTDEYQQLKAAGYAWAPKQECFYAVWSPHRESTALQFADEIEDEDKSLVDRAEDRADRFEGYSDNRAKDADRAHAAVKAIADHIPLGQPILVGHHSERRARKDAQRIENGMRHAVKMWETSEYWTRRAAGALAHAKYKERPDVRHRRIKGLEADKRKQEKYKTVAEKSLELWSREDLTLEMAIKIAGCTEYGRFNMARKEGDREDWSYTPTAYAALKGDHPTLYAPRTLQEVIDTAKRVFPRTIAHCDTWINHINNRLEYERAMLAEAGGTAADKWTIEVGGRVLVRGEWVTVVRVNKSGNVVNSLTTNRRYVAKVGIEEVKDYQPPTEEQAAAVKKATEKAPICNYPANDIIIINRYQGTHDHMGETVAMTKAEWAKIHTDYKTTQDVPATETAERHRVRVAVRSGSLRPVFLTDDKQKDPPAKSEATEVKPTLPPPKRVATALRNVEPVEKKP